MAAAAVAAVPSAADLATKFWGSIPKFLGRNTIEITTVRQGRKVVYQERTVLGQTRIIDRREDPKVPLVTTKRSIQRWEILPIAILGAGAAAWALSSTTRGSAAIGKAKTYRATHHLPNPLASFESKLPGGSSRSLINPKPPAWNLQNPLGWANVPAWF